MSARAATLTVTALGGAMTLLFVVGSFYAPPGRGVLILIVALGCALFTAYFLELLREVDR